ncbi:hypothetical protein DWB85_10135 [Seongchinamella sediminis]|uniref:Uncharacterized protein n=1 Tax=Seongchinamella sediminis TaxID=2283635 RepID=A0A3L7E178_9GAMM|nr:hypothetical protein [Seongchinamella sediminis]RLQ22011.1 hypothetical protein DWB85_10135 [Seongchinamella sediminis]
MTDSVNTGNGSTPGQASASDAISLVQRGNLKTLEKTLRKQWRLGQNIVLCWSADERGLLVIFVPHYFLGNYCAEGAEHSGNEAYIREMISGQRRKTREEMFAVSRRLEVAPTFIKLNTALSEEPLVLQAVEQLIRRYGLSYVENRAVLLFDIVEFSLYTPFEQASQLNSLSYSLNSAYNKLLSQGIEINFARTTTGDGYYIWNRSLGPEADRDLFYFMLLVVADNAVARAASRGNTVPLIRAAYHVGGHYELYQAEGVNPTVFSYIVGDVTIELARMVELAAAGQLLIGDFFTSLGDGPLATERVSTPAFVAACNRGLEAVVGTQLSSKQISTIQCWLSKTRDEQGESVPRRFRIVDKHGFNHYAYNLQLKVSLEDKELLLGLDDAGLAAVPQATAKEAATAGGAVQAAEEQPPAASAEAMFDDLASLLRKRKSSISED